MSAPAAIGHNSATPAEIVAGLTERLRAWLSDNPVIQDHETANAAANLRHRISLTLMDMEDARKQRTRPLREHVSAINAEFAAAEEPIRSAADMIGSRQTAYAKAEEARREAIAAEWDRVAIEARGTARRAAAALTEARENAEAGEVGADMLGAVAAIQAAETAAARAEREADRADRDVRVKMAPGLGGRSQSLRSRETLELVDPIAAVTDLAQYTISVALADAIVSAARAFRTVAGRLPAGVKSTIKRKV